MNRRRHQEGIALIITLIMLAVVTLMAVAFLAVSRRERSAVTTSSDRVDAREMAEAGLERAEADILSRVIATSNLLSYDFLVSTNYFNPKGFAPGNTNIANVSYRYSDGTAVSGNDLLQLYRNLEIDPRAPVFVETNAANGEQEFRYYLDYNRNGLVETNGVQLEINATGGSLGVTNFHVGDPEWIAVLRRPDQPHSGSNHFVGRFAYMILPVGKTLDLNFIHNHVKQTQSGDDGFFRNQGVGSWEINLAAFLHDLNTNAWPTYLYQYGNLLTSSTGVSFDDAFALLQHRYNDDYRNLSNVVTYFGSRGATLYPNDGIDGYSDGPLQTGINREYNGTAPAFTILDDDISSRPWPGSDNPGQFISAEELYHVSDVAGIGGFTNRLTSISSTNLSTYNRFTLYRLLAQLGTESVTEENRKIHLNYDNRLDFYTNLTAVTPGANVGYHTTNFVRWDSLTFFTNTADRILKTLHPPPTNGLPLIAVTNIAIWPTNLYSPAVHRELQLAANIFDATTNRGSTHPYYPSVFRPLFNIIPGVTDGRRIVGYTELPNPNQSVDQFWNEVTAPDRPPAFAGIPLVIGAKKGFPNFNEFRLRAVAIATRKLELVKRSPGSLPAFTNQMYILSVSADLGVEFWNSYQAAYPRQLEVRTRLVTSMVLSNEYRAIPIRSTNQFIFQPQARTFNANEWTGMGTPNAFYVPIETNFVFLPPSVYIDQGPNSFFVPVTNALRTTLFQAAGNFRVPTWRLNVTNHLQAILIDKEAAGGPRIVDFVDLNNMNSQIDITRELAGEDDASSPNAVTGRQTSETAQFWRTNRVQGVPIGIKNQIQVSLGQPDIPDWRSASAEPLVGQDKQKAQQRFREFVGLSPAISPASPTLRMQVPFSPSRKLFQDKSWQVNDPLVNDLVWDLIDPQSGTNLVERRGPLDPTPEKVGGLHQENRRYRPWRVNPNSSSPTARQEDFNVALKDPQITQSDDWDFPTNTFPSIGWLGRVHRGTPWQTIYLKSTAVDPTTWQNWSGHPMWVWPGQVVPLGTQPTNDWQILDLFTVAPNENADRGSLAVNQDGLAAWSAVLSGVPIFTNTVPSTNYDSAIIQPGTLPVALIVDGINRTRLTRFGQKYNYMGEVLSAPELSVASPYLVMAATPTGTPADAVVERIPQMILSLLRKDEPRFAVLAYGQSLRPAPGSVVTEPGPFFQMPTNYVITGEYVTKTLMHLEQFVEPDPITGAPRTRIRPVKEFYNEVPPSE